MHWEVAHGIADDLYQQLLWRFILKHQNYCARDEYVYQNPIVQRNIGILKEVGYQNNP